MRYQRDLHPGPDWASRVLVLWEAYETFEWFSQSISKTLGTVLGTLEGHSDPLVTRREEQRRQMYLAKHGWVLITGPYYAAIGVVVKETR